MRQPSHSPAASSAEFVDLREYVAVLRRRWAFVVLVVIACAATAATYSYTRTPIYRAEAEVLLTPSSSSDTARPSQLVSLDTEARLAVSAPTARIAKEALATSQSIEDLLRHAGVSTTPETLVLDISYWATDPAQAAAGANAFADAYLEYKQEQAVESLAKERQGVQSVIDSLVRDRDGQSEILENATPGTQEYRNATSTRDALNAQIAILTAKLAETPVLTDPGEVILPAVAPNRPSSPNHTINIGLGLILGLFIGVASALVWDRIDDRIRSRDDLETSVDAPVLASIPRVAGWTREGPVWLITERQPRSPAAEAYRTLRTSVMAIGRRRDLRVIAVVGATLGDGKTATAANLAAAIAHADKRVLAVSADLRRPRLHDYFGIENGPGLSEVLAEEVALQDVIRYTSSNLYVVTSGAISGRPAELLQSQTMVDTMQLMARSFDFVIIDTPPILGLADTLAIAPLADGVLFVAHAEASKRVAVTHAVEQLEQIGARAIGSVLTNVAFSRRSAYGYGYGADQKSTDAGPASDAEAAHDAELDDGDENAEITAGGDGEAAVADDEAAPSPRTAGGMPRTSASRR